MKSHAEKAMEPDPREERLPRWAQSKIQSLRGLLEGVRAELLEFLKATDPEGSEAVLNPYGNFTLGTPGQGLGKRALVRWPLDSEGRRRGIDVRQTSDGKWLHVSGDGRLVIECDASNLIRIRVDQS